LVKWATPVGFAEVFVGCVMLVIAMYSGPFEMKVLSGTYWFVAMCTLSVLGTWYLDSRILGRHFREALTGSKEASSEMREAVAKPSRSYAWVIAIVTPTVVAACAYLVYSVVAEGETFVVYADHTFRIERGSPIRYGTDGPVIGEILSWSNTDDPRGRFALKGKITNERIAARLLRKSTLVFPEMESGEGIHREGLDLYFRLRALVMWESDPQAPPHREFTLQTDHPPDRRVEWDDVFVRVRGRYLGDKVPYGTMAVSHDDGEVAMVWQTSTQGPDGDWVRTEEDPGDQESGGGSVTLCIFDHKKADSCPYSHAGTTWWIPAFQVQGLRVKHAEGAVGKKKILVAGDPAGPAKTVFDFRGEVPPEQLPRHDDLRVVVEWESIGGLKVGSPVKNASVPGIIYDIRRPGGGGKFRVTLNYSIHQDEKIPEACEGASYYRARPKTKRLSMEYIEAAFEEYVLVSGGDPDGESVLDFVGREELPPDPLPKWKDTRLVVYWPHAKQLEVGAPLFGSGGRNGVVHEMTWGRVKLNDIERDMWRVVVVITDSLDPNTLPETREGTEVFLATLQTWRMEELKHVEAGVKGTFVWLVPGDPAGEPLPKIEMEGQEVCWVEGRLEPPPHPLVSHDTPAIFLDIADGQGLLRRAPVTLGGAEQIAEIDSWVPSPEPGMARARVLVWDQLELATNASSRYYPDYAQLGPGGPHGTLAIRGTTRNLVAGTSIQLVPDPAYPGAPGQQVFRLQNEPPPLTIFRPRHGDKRFFLDSSARVPTHLPAFTPILHEGGIAGYVWTGGTGKIEVRIKKKYFPRVRRSRTIFFLEKNVEASFGLLGGAQFEADVGALIRQAVAGGPAIVFRTAQDCGGQAPPDSTFILYAEQPEECENWHCTIPLAEEGSERNTVARLKPVPVIFSWKKKGMNPFRSSGEYSGLGFAVDSGWVVAPKECLQPDVPDKDLDPEETDFTIGGKRYTRRSPKYEQVAPGVVAFKVKPQGSTLPFFPLEELGHIASRRDLSIKLGPGPSDGRFVPVHLIKVEKGVWQVDSRMKCQPDWHGAPVVDKQSGRVVGLLLSADGSKNAVIAPFSEQIKTRLRRT
jgi:hypothetical protein